jgi:DDE family transposase
VYSNRLLISTNLLDHYKELPFKELLPEALLRKIHRSGCRRATVFTPLITLRAFLFQVLSINGSCTEAVGHVLLERIGSNRHANTLNTGPYCKARARLTLGLLTEAVMETGQTLHRQASSHTLWMGFRVLLADGTTCLMPDTDSNQQTYPQQSTQKPGLGFPIVRLVGLLSLATGACTAYTLAPYQGKGNGETSLFSRLIASLTRHDLLIADRFYTSFAIIALVRQQGSALVFRQRGNVKTDFRLGRRLGAKDHLIQMKKPPRKPVWLSDSQWLALPDTLDIREFSVDGVVYITSLSDAKVYPKQQVAQLYQQRWNIELDFRTLKTQMGMEMLRCKTDDMVNKEIAVHLLAYNLIRASMAKAACLNQKFPREQSFMAASRLLRQIAGLAITAPHSLFDNFILPLLRAMTDTTIGHRKRPKQPRVVKRRPKAYPLMIKPRCEY